MGGDGPAIPAINGEGGGTGTRSDAPAPSKARNRDRTGDLILTKDVLYRLSYACRNRRGQGPGIRGQRALFTIPATSSLPERETGLEPATSSLEGLRSTS